MSNVSFEEWASIAAQNAARNATSVKFLTLKNDNDEAIVRIMHDSTNDFDIVPVHQFRAGGRFNTYSCLRDAKDPIEKCPLCAKGVRLEYRMYIHMLQYVRQEDGKIQAVPVVWERGYTYAQKLANMIQTYGPLSDCIFKIIRHGAANSTSTSYDILYCPPQAYPVEVYPKTVELIENYHADGTTVYKADYAKLAEVAAGIYVNDKGEVISMPQAAPQQAYVQQQPYIPQPAYAPIPPQAPVTPAAPVQPVQPVAPAPVTPAAPAAPISAAPVQPVQPVAPQPAYVPPVTPAAPVQPVQPVQPAAPAYPQPVRQAPQQAQQPVGPSNRYAAPDGYQRPTRY